MELADIAGSLRRHWKISVSLLMLAAAVLGIFLVTRKEVLPDTEYQATVQILIPARDDKGARPAGVPPVLLQGQLALARSKPVKDDAMRIAGLKGDAAREVKLFPGQQGADIFVTSARAPDELVAVRAANAYANAYISARSQTVGSGAKSRQKSLLRAMTVYTARIRAIETELRAQDVPLPSAVPEGSTTDTGTTADIPVPAGASQDAQNLLVTRNTLLNSVRNARNQYARAEVESLTPTSFATIVERPAPTRVTPPAPSPLIPSAVALGVGLLLAIAVPILIDRLDNTVKDAKTAAMVFEAPVLSAIPPTSRAGYRAMARPGSAHDAAFRSLAATSVATDRLPRAILVTAPTGRVQDMVAANFASALASMGLRVALVATAASQSWFLNASTDGGEAITLPDLLDKAHRGALNGEADHRLATTDLANLLIVPPGTGDDLELPLDGLPPLLAALQRADIDITVIAGPSLLEDPNATIFAWATRSVLWAVESGDVTRADAQEATARLVLAGVDPFGVALVGREA